MKNKDLMKDMSVESYVREIMKIPIKDASKNYNRSGEPRKDGCPAYMRDFAKYRSLCLRENLLKQDIRTAMAQLLREEKEGREDYEVKSGRIRLRDMFLRLGKLTLQKRELESRRDSIECDFVREIVIHRYFEDLHRRLPTWSQTASELGIAVSGEELRRYVCSRLSAG